MSEVDTHDFIEMFEAEVKPSVSGTTSLNEDVFDEENISTIYSTEIDGGWFLVEFTSKQAAEKFVQDWNTDL